MKNTLIAIAILLASCTQEEPYFIDAEIIAYNNNVRVESEATEGVKEIIVEYEYFLSPGELSQSKQFKAPINNQNAGFIIDRQDQLNYLRAIVIDSKGNSKTINL